MMKLTINKPNVNKKVKLITAIIVSIMVFILAMGIAFAASVSRSMPSKVEPGQEVEVTLTLNGAPTGQQVAIEENLPNTLTVKSWEISGSQESKAEVGYIKKPSAKAGIDRHSWTFTAASGSPSVKYKFDAPSSEGSHTFDVRWVTSEGFNHQEATLAVRTIRCGDGVCEGNENSDNCESDCPKPAPPAPTPEPEAAPPQPPVEKRGAGTTILIVVAVLVVVALIIYFFKKKKE